MTLTALREQLAAVLAPVRPASDGLSTGVAELDAVLVGGGLPRGRLTEVVGARGSGKTTLLRRAVTAAAQRGVWVAYVDASRTLWARDWARVADAARAADGRLCVVRPMSAARGAWCADVLLRSGAFGLVVLDGAPPLTRASAVRLTRLARDADAALVVLGEDERSGSALGGALRLRLERRAGQRGGGGWDEWGARRVAVRVEKGGNHQTVEVGCAIGVARRLCTHPEVPDRRGVAGRARGSSAGGGRDGVGTSGTAAVAGPATSGGGGRRRRRA